MLDIIENDRQNYIIYFAMRMKVFTGSSNTVLARRLADLLGVCLGDASVGRFNDGEVCVRLNDPVKGCDVVLLQSTCAPHADHLMELLALADAARRSSAKSITAVIPYFGYARQDRCVEGRQSPIMAKVVADALSHVGIDRFITLDLHTEQIPGYFTAPVEHVHGTSLIAEDIRKQSLKPLRIVSPDVGGVLRAQAVSESLGENELVVINKKRNSTNSIERMDVMGSVDGCHCVIVDDLVDTGKTLIEAARALKKAGAVSVRAYATHAVLSTAADFLSGEHELDECVVTDSIPVQSQKVRVLSIDALLAQTVGINIEEVSK